MCADVKSYGEIVIMHIETMVGLAASALLLVYLIYALLRPEKF